MFNALIELALRGLLYFALHFENTNAFPKQLSAKEERECFEKAANGDQKARDKLIVHNLRLVAFMVRKNFSDYKEQDDLISIGIIGLIKAVETFNYEKGTQFSTYASKCIDNQIRMHFRKNKNSIKDIYIYDSIDSDKDGNPITFVDIISDPSSMTDEVDLNINMEKLYKYVDECLEEREKTILSHRYGLYGIKSLPQREVAEKLNISRSYVSRIEKKALEKLLARFERSDKDFSKK